ncbi:MAG: Bor/Iss family lipoprotein [Planctomycetota bacterium]
MKKLLAATLVLLLVMPMIACQTFRHNVGKGAQGHTVVAEKGQWFILWGLVPLTPSPSADGGKMAKDLGLSDYTVQTQYTIVDVIISFFTLVVTINKQTVTVEK